MQASFLKQELSMSHCFAFSSLKLDTLPFEDSKMKYDFEEHRYVLEQSYLKLKKGIDLTELLGSATKAKIFLDDISEKMYNFIYETANDNCKKNNIQVKEYLLAKDHEIREFIVKAMLFQARASANTDIDMLGDEHRINLESGQRIEIKISDSFSNDCLQALDQSEILFKGIYRNKIDQEDYRVGY